MYFNSRSVSIAIKEGKIGILPYLEEFQGPNLYYCHLGSNILIPQSGKVADTKNITEDLYTKKEILNYYDLAPGEFILAETFEVFSTDNEHIIRLFNSSSLARLGVVHCASGMINPGCGIKKPVRLTLELTNTGPMTVRLYPTITDTTTGKVKEMGTEVLKVAIAKHEQVTVAYEDWKGSIYGADEVVTGSRIDRRGK